MDTHRELPETLSLTEDYEIQEPIADCATRILLHPSKCYLNDDVVQLEEVIEMIVERYNQHEALLSYQEYVSLCINQNRVPQTFEVFKKDLSLVQVKRVK